MQKDTVTAFRNVLRRIYAKENKEKYHLICTKTSNQDEGRIWKLCKAFWHPEYLCRTSDIEKYEPDPSLDDAIAKRYLKELNYLIETEATEVIETLESIATVTEVTVSSQEELEAALIRTFETVTIDITDKVEIEIPEGTYDMNLIVNADVKNSGTFSSITINAIAANTWYECGLNNQFTFATLANSHIWVGPNAIINRILVVDDGTNVIVDVEGTIKKLDIDSATVIQLNPYARAPVEEINVNKTADVEINADEECSSISINVSKDLDGAKFASNAQFSMTSEADIDVVLEKGAEGSTVNANAERQC